MELFIHNLAPIMFLGLIIFLLMGFPVAFSLGACGLFFGFIGIELGVLPEALLQALPLRIFGIMQNDTLLAIPFFTLMGLILERSGMAEDLLDTIGQLFGPVRGGIAQYEERSEFGQRLDRGLAFARRRFCKRGHQFIRNHRKSRIKAFEPRYH